MKIDSHSRFGLLILAAAATLSAAALDPATALRIARAKDQITRNPAQPDAYTSLALALVKASRATDSADYLKQADEAVAHALRVAPDNFEAHKARVAILLAQSRYPEALSEAEALNRKVPDDNQLYGYLADAHIALGDYAAAEKSTQWMIDQRAVNAAALQRGAELRDVFGFAEASLEWWNSSLRITSASDSEERAWILANMSRVALRMGKVADAEKYARQSLDLVTGYPPAADSLAATLIEEDKAGDAAEVLRRRLDAAPNARAEFHFAEALSAAGKPSEAAEAFSHFEKTAAALVSQPDNANRELIEYYATHNRAADAVKLAGNEVHRRHDIPTLSVYALALIVAGNYREARVQMERALAPGIRDAGLFLQAGLISAKLHDQGSATRYLRKAIGVNASSPEADKAIRLLQSTEN